MSLFTADEFEGTPIDCNEGVLEWVEKERISELNRGKATGSFSVCWKRGKISFSLKLVYDTEDVLIHAVLDGKRTGITEWHRLMSGRSAM